MRKAVSVVAERKACGVPCAERRVRVPWGLVEGGGWRGGVGLFLVGGAEEEPTCTTFTPVTVSVRAGMNKVVEPSLLGMTVRRGWFWLQALVSSCVPVE